ncbi:NTP transferase domain-containing protein [Candidatus Methanodesulfokora washburnensis]|jgi:adenosylcobinamide-phosphate guanylyltransferase|uniref:Nucleotidyltransferase n=2 Tax=Candidatus Methanodesulfokora washburnensis TaxID=2478471 RepID=A0A429GGB1_9CREN|nr:NTP transferase domain-containing protein [Candidatus Methanodesulfokores washburnensis]RSN72822.1 nucleotidyltransferase [Candidatus Methanodesulfokores washburnensis]
MNVTALVMAGGRGSRLNLSEEKPLLKLSGRPLIEYVLDALNNAHIDDIVVAVSDYTRKTAEYIKKKGLRVIHTPGSGFCLDAKYAIEKLSLETTLTVSADLPFITGKFIDEVLAYYEQSGKPALTVVAPLEVYRKYNSSEGYPITLRGQVVVPIGVNVVNGARIKEEFLDQDFFIIYDEKTVININKVEDLWIAERLLIRTSIR